MATIAFCRRGSKLRFEEDEDEGEVEGSGVDISRPLAKCSRKNSRPRVSGFVDMGFVICVLGRDPSNVAGLEPVLCCGWCWK